MRTIQLLNKSALLTIFLLLSSCSSDQNSKAGFLSGLIPDIDTEPSELFGLKTDSFEIVHGVIEKNQFLADILLKYHVPYPLIHEIAMESKKVFDVRKLERGKPFTIFCAKDSTERALYFIYQPNDIDFVVYDFKDDKVRISLQQKPVEITERQIEGEIKSSLYESLQKGDHPVMLAFEMAEIFAWTIDFYRLQKGDYYKVIFDEKMVDGKAIGIDRIKAILFVHEGRDNYAYYFEQENTGSDYFDEAAESLRRAFLKSPLKFSRLTSGYTQKRFHPVQKRWKAHLGTDYAAPSGTPILTTGDGKVIEAGYKKYNGNYVKIRHNSTYMTQYLHMSKIKEGIKSGTYVKQGDVIGYVGSTGLATGPHVCYRFWKHGSQVNHLKEEFPPSEPVRKENLEKYFEYILPFQTRLNEGKSVQG